MATPTRPPTERAAQLFWEQSQQIPGVLRVERSGDLMGKEAFRVSVRKGDRDARYAVYQLEADTYGRFEGVSLDIHVSEEASPDEPESTSAVVE
jgi:hypothetical protein